MIQQARSTERYFRYNYDVKPDENARAAALRVNAGAEMWMVASELGCQAWVMDESPG